MPLLNLVLLFHEVYHLVDSSLLDQDKQNLDQTEWAVLEHEVKAQNNVKQHRFPDANVKWNLGRVQVHLILDLQGIFVQMHCDDAVEVPALQEEIVEMQASIYDLHQNQRHSALGHVIIELSEVLSEQVRKFEWLRGLVLEICWADQQEHLYLYSEADLFFEGLDGTPRELVAFDQAALTANCSFVLEIKTGVTHFQWNHNNVLQQQRENSNEPVLFFEGPRELIAVDLVQR